MCLLFNIDLEYVLSHNIDSWHTLKLQIFTAGKQQLIAYNNQHSNILEWNSLLGSPFLTMIQCVYQVQCNLKASDVPSDFENLLCQTLRNPYTNTFWISCSYHLIAVIFIMQIFNNTICNMYISYKYTSICLLRHIKLYKLWSWREFVSNFIFSVLVLLWLKI